MIMRRDGTYNSLINACVKSGDLDRAFDVLKLLSEDKIAPNTVRYELY